MSGGNRALRPLLAGAGESSIGQKAASDKRTEKLARVTACQDCRQRRIKCDSVRPSCGACARRKSHCDYTKPLNRREQQMALERQNGELQGVIDKANHAFELLKTLPIEDALNYLRHIRSAANPLAALNLMANGLKRPRQLSELETARNVVPAVQSGLEYELMVSHPMSYPTLLPVVLSATDTDRMLRVPGCGQERSADLRGMSTTTSGPSSSSDVTPDGSTSHSADDGRRPRKRRRLTESNTARRPEIPTTIFDERLRHLDIRHWSNVAVSSDTAARLIAIYLKTDYPTLGMFDADSFISDLLGLGNRFCSPLLVNALLFWSAHAYASLDCSAAQLSADFLEEFESLWQSHQDRDSLLTMTALTLLGYGCIGQGKERLASQYLLSATEMATRMRVFELERFDHMSSDEAHAASQAIWGHFIVQMVTSVSYRNGIPAQTPQLSVPEVDASSMQSSFRALCEFWIIVHGLARVYYNGDKRPVSQRVEIEFAELTYQKLLHWADGLPYSLETSELSPHHVLNLHIWYHAMIMDIFRPFLSREYQLKSFSSLDSSPKAVFTASLNQLKRLVLNYRLYCPAAAYSLWWQTGMLYVANGVVRDSSDPDWKFYLLLCIRGYQALANTYPVAGGFVQSILSMALDNKRMLVSEARQVLWEGNHKRHGQVDVIEGTWMTDLDLALSSQTDAQMEKVVSRFVDSSLFEEFTSLDEHPEDGQ